VPAPPVVNHKVSRPARDWAAYNNELRDRPVKAIDVIIDTATIGQWRPQTGLRGRPALSVEAITACYMLRAIFNLPLRATEGLLVRIFEMAELDPALVPDFSTLCKRRDDVVLKTPRRTGPVVLIDGTGVAFRQAGPWIVHKWRDGKPPKRRFVRVVISVDAATGAITDATVTSDAGEGSGEVSQFDGILSVNVEKGAEVIIGDGAYDTAWCYQRSRESGVVLIAPPRINAAYGLDPDRDQVLTQVRRHGTKGWKVKVGYHTRSLVESDIGALKACFGDQTRAHTLAGAAAEVKARINLHNLWRGVSMA
jgi:hypothetical protein